MITKPLTIGMLERYSAHCKTAQALDQPTILAGANDVLRMIKEIEELRNQLRSASLTNTTECSIG